MLNSCSTRAGVAVSFTWWNWVDCSVVTVPVVVICSTYYKYRHTHTQTLGVQNCHSMIWEKHDRNSVALRLIFLQLWHSFLKYWTLISLPWVTDRSTSPQWVHQLLHTTKSIYDLSCKIHHLLTLVWGFYVL